MEKKILQEIRELRIVLARVIGTEDLAIKNQFSIETLDKAASDFKKMSIERGDWVKDEDIYKIIKGSHYHSGNFIRSEFGFKNFFKRGRTYYYYKKDIIALAKELKERNVNLGRYMELKEDQAKFKKYISTIPQNKKGKKKERPYHLPDELKDITSDPPKMPSVDLVREDLKKLKEEFFQFKLSDYVDIYNDNHAMMKFIYHFEKYLDPQLKRRCKKWCDDFNYANHALELITNKSDKFIPVPEEDMIQL